MNMLKEFRTAQGISQEELAELVGVSRQTISKWENAVVQPSADNLMRLSQVLQLPLEAFLKDDWKPPEQQAVEAVAILPEPPQDTDAGPVVLPAEEPPEPDLAPAAPPAEVPQVPADEVPPPRRRNCRLWCALAAVIAVLGIIAALISFNGRGDMTPILEIERERVDKYQNMYVTLQPVQP